MCVCLLFQSPNTLWVDVIRELDGGELLLKDRQGLTLLITILKLGLQTQGYPPDRFPVDLFYRHWKNPESQVSAQPLANDYLAELKWPLWTFF